MELIRGLHNVAPRHRGCALTVGNFDGVHLGHQAIVRQLRAEAAGLPTTLMIFEPHPLEFFRGDNAPLRLTGLAEKLLRLRATGIDRVLLVRFTAGFGALAPREFIDEVLAARLGVRLVVVGDDFRFGAKSAGDFTLLTECAAPHGFRVARHETFELDGERVSSSRVRKCLEAGDLRGAEALLGATYNIQGRVAYGRQLGRTIGFPTANVRLDGIRPPICGVFAVRVDMNGEQLAGVANVGRRPTVVGEDVQLEVHLFNFNRSIYGQRIRVELVERLRPERKFESLDALKVQIARDAAGARRLLGVDR
ncbi:MAG: bifunctional riboflavin kinase/FAD synthetase [Gammaproteobacteria bacterium]|nr:bifunctional riboflavin kinase/FAD synthetase [Gammaproteobacteria bacterium]